MEIGGEFWEIDLCRNHNNRPIVNDHCLYKLAGRTALDYIIKDIKLYKVLRSIYMPSYCCPTMIRPFLDNGINVEFYNVGFNNGRYTYDMDFETQCDAVLIMQYFGYCNQTVGQTVNTFNKFGKIIIEDATHSWFSGDPYSYKSDYVYASFRKWTGVPCGAIVIKHNSNFVASVPNAINDKYINMRRRAALLKKRYIEENEGDKGTFLGLFNRAEKLLNVDYQDYGIPENYGNIIAKIDVEKIKRSRKLNAKFLVKELQNCKGIETADITDDDTPLFVPVIVHGGKRDELRRHLIYNGVYCPAHWPISGDHRINDFSLYENSLSLVCDQRYGLSDMERMMGCINDFYQRTVRNELRLKEIFCG